MTLEELANYLESGEGPMSDLAPIRAALSAESTWAELPVGMEDTVVAEITAEAPGGEAAVVRSAARWWTGMAAAAIAVLVGTSSLIGANSHRVNLTATDLAVGASAFAIVTDTSSGIHVVLDVDGLDPAPAGSYYQGWLTKGDDLITIGTFHMRGGDGRVDLWAGVDLGEYDMITITLQDAASGQDSSGQVVLKGDLPDA